MKNKIVSFTLFFLAVVPFVTRADIDFDRGGYGARALIVTAISIVLTPFVLYFIKFSRINKIKILVGFILLIEIIRTLTNHDFVVVPFWPFFYEIIFAPVILVYALLAKSWRWTIFSVILCVWTAEYFIFPLNSPRGIYYPTADTIFLWSSVTLFVVNMICDYVKSQTKNISTTSITGK